MFDSRGRQERRGRIFTFDIQKKGFFHHFEPQLELAPFKIIYTQLLTLPEGLVLKTIRNNGIPPLQSNGCFSALWPCRSPFKTLCPSSYG